MILSFIISEKFDADAVKSEFKRYLLSSSKLKGIDNAGTPTLRMYVERVGGESNAKASEIIVNFIVDKLWNLDPSPNKGFRFWIAKMFDVGYIVPELSREIEEAIYAACDLNDGAKFRPNFKDLRAKGQLDREEDEEKLRMPLREYFMKKGGSHLKEYGFDNNIQNYPDVASVINLPYEIDQKRDVKAPWLRIIRTENGSKKVFDDGDLIIMMTPKKSDAEKFGFTPQQAVEALKALGGDANQSSWCTRGGYSPSMADRYLEKNTIYTMFISGKPAYQFCFGKDKEIKDVRNVEQKIDNIPPKIRLALTDVASRYTSKLDNSYHQASEEEKAKKYKTFRADNIEYFKAFNELIDPQYLKMHPVVNEAFLKMLKNSTHGMARNLFNAKLNDFFRGEFAEAFKDATDGRSMLLAVKGTWLEPLTKIFFMNPELYADLTKTGSGAIINQDLWLNMLMTYTKLDQVDPGNPNFRLDGLYNYVIRAITQGNIKTIPQQVIETLMSNPKYAEHLQEVMQLMKNS